MRDRKHQFAMKISFVILTYHRGEYLQRCVDSILAQKNLPTPFEVLVIDNGGDASVKPSTTPDIVIRVHVPDENLWATGGRNLGMSLAQGEYIVVIDDDATWADEHAVQRMVHHLETVPGCGAVAVTSLTPEGKVIRSELPHPNKAYILAVSKPVEVPYFYTMGMALRAKILGETGDYPARFQIYAEEVDLSLRIIDAGYRIIFDPDIAVLHFRAQQGRPFDGDKYWYKNALNKIRVAWRLLPQPYPITTSVVWFAALLIKTRNPKLVFQLMTALWRERTLLSSERIPVKPDTVHYLRRIGARLLY